MTGDFHEYTWAQILQLIWEDVGLKDKNDQMRKGELIYRRRLEPPENEKDICIEVKVYDKPYEERLKERK